MAGRSGKRHARGPGFEQEELEYLRGQVDATGTVPDIGAKLRNHTVFFAPVIGAACVLSFEPGDFAFPRLSFNVALNGLEDRVRLYRMALSDRAGRAAMRFSHVDNHGTLAMTEVDGAEQSVVIARGDAVVGSARVTFTKIDVDRHEFEVLVGLSETIAPDRPLLMVEADLDAQPRLEGWLAAMGYEIRRTFPRYGDIVNVVAGAA